VAGVVIATAVVLILVTDRGINVTADFGMIRCLYGFGLGVLGYAFWRQHGAPLDQFGWTQRSLIEALGLLVVGIAIMLLADGRASLLLPPMFLALVLGFAGEGGAIGRLLRASPLLFLGTISYGIYMVHVFVQARLEDGLRLLALAGGPDFVQTSGGRSIVGTTALEGALLTILMLLLVIVVSHLAYLYVEQPGIRLGRRLFGSRSPATT
jgi:peptidoglycan/LPS O-acetylase OafA/YrhL